jgi:hypothetical protein
LFVYSALNGDTLAFQQRYDVYYNRFLKGPVSSQKSKHMVYMQSGMEKKHAQGFDKIWQIIENLANMTNLGIGRYNYCLIISDL